MPDTLTETQQQFIQRLQHQDMDTIAEEMALSFDTIIDWQKDYQFQVPMLESLAIIKQKTKHRVLLRCLSMMESLDHLQEHVSQREQMRIMEHVVGIIEKLEIHEASIIESIRQKESADAKAWRDHQEREKKGRERDERVRKHREWVLKNKDSDYYKRHPDILEMYREEEDNDEDEGYEEEAEGCEDDVEEDVQQTEPAQSSYAQPNSPPRVGEGPGEGSNRPMDQQQMSDDSSPNTSAFSAPSAVQEDIQEERRPRYGEMYCGHLWDIPDPRAARRLWNKNRRPKNLQSLR